MSCYCTVPIVADLSRQNHPSTQHSAQEELILGGTGLDSRGIDEWGGRLTDANLDVGWTNGGQVSRQILQTQQVRIDVRLAMWLATTPWHTVT